MKNRIFGRPLREINPLGSESNITIQQAMEYILNIFSRLSSEGNDDIETPSIQAIISQMKQGFLSPDEAIGKVDEMMEGRNYR